MAKDNSLIFQFNEGIKALPDRKLSCTLVFVPEPWIQLNRRCVCQHIVCAVHGNVYVYRQLVQVLEDFLPQNFGNAL